MNTAQASWTDKPQPTTANQWIERAAEAAAILGVDTVTRDRANNTPHAEVQLLKDAGLVTLLGPRGARRCRTSHGRSPTG